MVSAAVQIHSSKSSEWYTPWEAVCPAYDFFERRIDLDPASCPLANKIIGASKFYTFEDDGLTKEWKGNIWLNPPYSERSSGGVAPWIEKAIETEQSGAGEVIALLNMVPDRKWFQRFWDDYTFVMLPKRVRFLREENGELVPGPAPTHPSCYVYFGRNQVKFARVFSHLGRVVWRRGVTEWDVCERKT